MLLQSQFQAVKVEWKRYQKVAKLWKQLRKALDLTIFIFNKVKTLWTIWKKIKSNSSLRHDFQSFVNNLKSQFKNDLDRSVVLPSDKLQATRAKETTTQSGAVCSSQNKACIWAKWWEPVPKRLPLQLSELSNGGHSSPQELRSHWYVTSLVDQSACRLVSFIWNFSYRLLHASKGSRILWAVIQAV